jgi:hypothetical protein
VITRAPEDDHTRAAAFERDGVKFLALACRWTSRALFLGCTPAASSHGRTASLLIFAVCVSMKMIWRAIRRAELRGICCEATDLQQLLMEQDAAASPEADQRGADRRTGAAGGEPGVHAACGREQRSLTRSRAAGKMPLGLPDLTLLIEIRRGQPLVQRQRVARRVEDFQPLDDGQCRVA